MRKKTLLTLITASIGVCFMGLTSCKKKTVDTNTQVATDHTLCEDELMRMLPTVNSIAIKSEGEGVKRVTGTHYPQITVTDTTKSPGWPRTLTINYGPGVRDSSDGKTRAGIITVSFTNYWHDVGTTATVSYSGYLVNNVNYIATGGDIQLYRNSDTTFTETVGGIICKASDWTISYSSSRVFRWIQGVGDTIPGDSKYMITGTGSGMDRNQVKYTMSITSPLIWSNSCGYIVSGDADIIPAGLADRIIDYGSGGCDNQANVTIDGNSYSLTLQ